MTENLLWAALLILGGLLLVGYKTQILTAFRRFDARNRERIAQERQDRADALAHFRHTLRLAEEQVEQVSPIIIADERTGAPVTRYLFEGETFLSEADAVQAREGRMRAIALGFYVDLPAALRARRSDDKLKSN